MPISRADLSKRLGAVPAIPADELERLRTMSDDEAHANALADPDAQPMSEADLSRAVEHRRRRLAGTDNPTRKKDVA